jgi:hypothetical protein
MSASTPAAEDDDVLELLSPEQVAIHFDEDFASEHLHAVDPDVAESLTLETQQKLHASSIEASLVDSVVQDTAASHKDAPADKILDAFYDHVEERTMHHFGYPYNLDFRFEELFRFMRFSINNLGRPVR